MFFAPREGRLGSLLYCLNLGIHVRGIFMGDHNDEMKGLDRADCSATIGCSLRTNFRTA